MFLLLWRKCFRFNIRDSCRWWWRGNKAIVERWEPRHCSIDFCLVYKEVIMIWDWIEIEPFSWSIYSNNIWYNPFIRKLLRKFKYVRCKEFVGTLAILLMESLLTNLTINVFVYICFVQYNVIIMTKVSYSRKYNSRWTSYESKLLPL